MQTEIIYNLRNRTIYNTIPSSVIDDLVVFVNTYRELLLDEHRVVISQLKLETFIDDETIKSVFRYFLNFVEIQIAKWRINKYNHQYDPSINNYLINEAIYFHRSNYLKMKKDLYEWYKTHIDSNHKYINKFLNTFSHIKNSIDSQFDDAQMMVEHNYLFGI